MRPRKADDMSAERMETVRAEGLTFHARISGQPGALLLLHGFTGSPESWNEVVEPVSSRLDVYALELPGHGGHEPIGEEAGFPEVVRDLAAALPRLRPGRWQVCGYSMGARLALGLMTGSPALCETCVLIGANPGLPSSVEREQRREWEDRWIRILRQEGLEGFLDAWESLPLFESQAELGDSRRELQKRIRAAHSAPGLAVAMDGLGLAAMPNYWPALSDVETPVELVAGERDPKFCGIAEEMGQRLQSATVRVIPGVGHNVLLEAPDAVVQTILSGGPGEAG